MYIAQSLSAHPRQLCDVVVADGLQCLRGGVLLASQLGEAGDGVTLTE